jgi:hypothetical protein
VSSAGLDFHPGRLWSLLEMLTKFARDFILLGERISRAKELFEFVDLADHGDPDKVLTEEEIGDLKESFGKIANLCVALNLETSKELFSEALDDLPATGREFKIYIDALYSEIKNKLFLFVPDHRRKYYIPKNFLAESTKTSFPNARAELAEAGRCFVVDRYTATVFHCMRAVEIGLRAVAKELDVKFPFPVEQAEWEPMINQIESKIAGLKDRPKDAEKDAVQKFYSEAAMQFRYFKDGWRIRVSHARESYDESQALSVIEHAAGFFAILSTRLKEPST